MIKYILNIEERTLSLTVNAEELKISNCVCVHVVVNSLLGAVCVEYILDTLLHF